MILSTRDLCFRRKHFSLGPLNLQFPKHSITHIRGQNGAGKTTLLKLLCGKLKPEQGSIDGRVFPMGTVGLGGLFFRTWTLEENYAWFSRLLKRPLSLGDLETWKHHRVHELSTGILRRAELRFLLEGNFAICLLDEAFGPLDLESRKVFYDVLFTKLRIQSTVILTTHFESDLSHKADQVIDL